MPVNNNNNDTPKRKAHVAINPQFAHLFGNAATPTSGVQPVSSRSSLTPVSRRTIVPDPSPALIPTATSSSTHASAPLDSTVSSSAPPPTPPSTVTPAPTSQTRETSEQYVPVARRVPDSIPPRPPAGRRVTRSQQRQQEQQQQQQQQQPPPKTPQAAQPPQQFQPPPPQQPQLPQQPQQPQLPQQLRQAQHLQQPQYLQQPRQTHSMQQQQQHQRQVPGFEHVPPPPPYTRRIPVTLPLSRRVPVADARAAVPPSRNVGAITNTTVPLSRQESIIVEDTIVEQRQERISISPMNIDSGDDDVTEVIPDDEPSASEVESSVGGGESDAGSTVETDDDGGSDGDEGLGSGSFSEWTVSQIRKWLSDHGVRYNLSDDLVQLRSIARAHKMFLETEVDDGDAVVKSDRNRPATRQSQQQSNNDSGSQASNMRSRKSRTRPEVLDDDDDVTAGSGKGREYGDDEDDEVVYVAPARRTKPKKKTRSGGRNSSRRKRVSQLRPPPLRRVTLATRLYAALFVVLAAGAVWSLGCALILFYRNATMQYCDYDGGPSLFSSPSLSTSKSNANASKASKPSNGKLSGWLESALLLSTSSLPGGAGGDMRCRPCPKNGRCSDGVLTCLPGYIDLDGRCAEDEEFSVYAEVLAAEAWILLKDIAGQTQCGDRTSRFLHAGEIAQAVRESEEARAAQLASSSLHWLRALLSGSYRRPGYDADKFDPAMAAALRVLTDEDSGYDVTQRNTVSSTTEDSEDHEQLHLKEYGSNVASLAFWCRVRLFLWQNFWRVTATLLLTVLVVYVRVKLALRRRYWRQVDLWHAHALDELRAHKEDFEARQEDYAFVKDVVLRADVVGRLTQSAITMWKDVEKRLNDDPRVLRGSRTVAGVPSYTFEWTGRRRSSSIGEGLSRRSSFGSRTSLDSMDMSSDRDDLSTSGATPSGGRQRGGITPSTSFSRFWSDRED